MRGISPVCQGGVGASNDEKRNKCDQGPCQPVSSIVVENAFGFSKR